ncbi:nicotinate-nucleotide pyrophosphorylase [Ignicoccus pacificus DSM 13166]|uniref:Nicotinate-nucleotide pyrophosphorylase [carboxylating] n=1 Tax=Ignicoccus pacificus DSM 13166 TaxID=940294 RepID=A0A977K935_9CREN|nr:nicotinate-nucleotide pyrophosphorylase [Ignicoccus pacificus DSM 13166]
MYLGERLKEDLLSWLKEDVPLYDLTTYALGDIGRKEFEIVAKSEVYACNLELVKDALSRMGIEVTFVKEGWIKGPFIRIKGDAKEILVLERTLLNFLIHVLSISTEVRRVREYLNEKGFEKVRLAVTRKTVPGMRLWAKLFASCAGADTHRLSLSDMLMIKDTHAEASGGLLEAVKRAHSRKSFAHKLEVEVRSLEEALEVLPYADVIMLDNFPPEEAKSAACELKRRRSEVVIEVSGGINKENVIEYLNECVDVVSMGYLTISPPRVDLSMRYAR